MDARQNPLVTIGIPTRNRRVYLEAALKSVLAQSWTNLEVVISDNASTDDTAAFLATIVDPRVKVLLQKENIGLTGNWRKCLDAAAGQFFLILSDDDLLDSGAIEMLVEPFLADTSATRLAMSDAPCRVISSDGRVLWETERGPARENGDEMIRGVAEGTRGFYPCSILAPTELVRKTNAFEEANGQYLDFALLLGLSIAGDVAHAQETAVSYRIHRNNATARLEVLESRALMLRIIADVERQLAADGRTDSIAVLRKARPKFISNGMVSIASNAIAARRQLPRLVRALWLVKGDLFTPYVFRRGLRRMDKVVRLFVR